jgi:hypothetical protein
VWRSRSKGRLNLHKFDEKLRAQLEGYLVQLGILKAQQVLKPDQGQAEPEAMDQQLVRVRCEWS